MDHLEENSLLLEKYLPFWQHLNTAQKNTLARNAVTTSYARDSHIHFGENDCIGMLIIKSGVMRTYLLSENGKEVTLYRLGAGEVCILSASCVLQTITFDVYIDAAEDCEILQINSSVVSGLMEENIHVEAYAYKLATERFSDVMWAMQQILFMSFDKRLAIFLLDECSRTKSDIIKMTHEQIAKYTGSAREVVSRMLKYFSSEGFVELSRGGIRILDKQGLKELL